MEYEERNRTDRQPQTYNLKSSPAAIAGKNEMWAKEIIQDKTSIISFANSAVIM